MTVFVKIEDRDQPCVLPLSEFLDVNKDALSPIEVHTALNEQGRYRVDQGNGAYVDVVTVNPPPTLIGYVAGHTFWEHPEYGDEAPLMMRRPDMTFVEASDFWELPDAEELAPVGLIRRSK